MSEGELAIRLEKRWIARDSLVQQIDCLQQIRDRLSLSSQKEYFGARIEIESNEILGRLRSMASFSAR